MKFLERFFPARQRSVAPIPASDRIKLLAGVTDLDPCLRAHLEILQERMEIEFNVLLDVARTDLEKLRACEGLRVTWMTLQTLENERANAKQWLNDQRTQTQ